MTVMIGLLMVALLTAFAGAPAQPSVAAVLPDDGGYQGAWVTAGDLDVEIFLPTGWTVSEEPGFRAAGEAGGSVRVEDLGALPEDQSLAEWAAASDPGRSFEAAVANGQQAVMAREGADVVVIFPCGGRAYRFSFTEVSEDLALQDRKSVV